MSGVSLSLNGALSVSRVADCPPGTTDTGCSFVLGLLPLGTSFTGGSEISQKEMTINSPSALVSLAFPASLRGRLVYFRPLTGTFTKVELTHATAGAVEYPVAGTLLAEFPEAEQVTAMQVQGQGTFEWVVAGVLV